MKVFQLDELKQALADLEAVVQPLHVDVGFTGKFEATLHHGSVPTVTYSIQMHGQVVLATGKPLPVTVTPTTLAAALQQVLNNHNLLTPQVQGLVQAVQNSPVA